MLLTATLFAPLVGALLVALVPAAREETGRLVAHPSRFPSGIPALVTYLHKRGLKAGIYTDAGGWPSYASGEAPADNFSTGTGPSSP